MALTMLHAGGKFGGGGYKVSGGLHGVGVSVVNALSSTLQVDVRNRGYHWRQTFSLGVPDGAARAARADGPGEETGTTVTYWASEDIFETTTYSLETITNRLREIRLPQQGPGDHRPRRAARMAGVADASRQRTPRARPATGTRRRRDRTTADGGVIEHRFCYERGLVDFVEHLNRRKDKRHPTRDRLRGRAARRAG